LIDYTQADLTPPKPKKLKDGRIPLKATLILIPTHLMNQVSAFMFSIFHVDQSSSKWPKEINKFLGKDTYEVLLLNNYNKLKNTTIQDFLDADIIVVSLALFTSTQYWESLKELSGLISLPIDKSAGRHFQAKLALCLEALKDRTQELVSGGVEKMEKGRRITRKKAKALSDEEVVIDTSTRAKGAAYKLKKSKVRNSFGSFQMVVEIEFFRRRNRQPKRKKLIPTKKRRKKKKNV
jgi:hypothetical protein